jgi:hypothetical protein
MWKVETGDSGLPPAHTPSHTPRHRIHAHDPGVLNEIPSDHNAFARQRREHFRHDVCCLFVLAFFDLRSFDPEGLVVPY